jgi:hypothetical protein
MNELVPIPATTVAVKAPRGIAVPGTIAAAGDHTARRFLEFFAATIRNRNTRQAYFRAVEQLFSWVERHMIGGLVDIEPLHVAAYVELLQTTMAKPTVKQHLAAIRMLFDWLVTGGVLIVNPAHAVRGPSHVVKRVKTPPCSPPTRPACCSTALTPQRWLACATARFNAVAPAFWGWWLRMPGPARRS